MTRQIELSGKDAAIVIRENGETAELYYPTVEDPNEVLSTNVVVLMALSIRLRDQTFVNELMAWFSKLVKENESALNDIQDVVKDYETLDEDEKTYN
jgi:hypothetical protein